MHDMSDDAIRRRMERGVEETRQIIKAAPDMLAALKEIRRYVALWAKPGTTGGHIAHICDEAIAKAEGTVNA